VLGTSDHGRNVQAYEWENLPQGLNVADFDVVVLNFMTLQATSRLGPDEHAGALANVPPAEDFARLIFSDGRVVAIGDPKLVFLHRYGHPVEMVARAAATWWLPFTIQVLTASGEAMETVSPEWQFWFDHVHRYTWHFTGHPTATTNDMFAVRTAVAEAAAALVKATPLAKTRFGEAIGAFFQVDAYRTSFTELRDLVKEATPVAWLPSPTDLEAHEASQLILAQVFDVERETAPPLGSTDWSYRVRRRREKRLPHARRRRWPQRA